MGTFRCPLCYHRGDIPRFSVPTRPERFRSAESTQMKFLQRMNEQPSSWLLLFGSIAIVGYLLYLVGDGLTW